MFNINNLLTIINKICFTKIPFLNNPLTIINKICLVNKINLTFNIKTLALDNQIKLILINIEGRVDNNNVLLIIIMYTHNNKEWCNNSQWCKEEWCNNKEWCNNSQWCKEEWCNNKEWGNNSQWCKEEWWINLMEWWINLVIWCKEDRCNNNKGQWIINSKEDKTSIFDFI